MASLSELARQHTTLTPKEIGHLQRLVSTWGLLADLCFSDLLLFGRTQREDLVVLGQIRPTTSQTLFPDDWIGRPVEDSERPLVADCFESGATIEGDTASDLAIGQVHEACIPVQFEGRTIAVLTRESSSSVGRQSGRLEHTYVEIFDRLTSMIIDGAFPFPADEDRSIGVPRVGDGVMLLDDIGRVMFASPNAVSALHRFGVMVNIEGMRFEELGLPTDAVRTAYARAIPANEEIERGTEVTVVVRFIPLLDRGRVTGAIALMRDISELRRRDLMLLSKDASIREIHHRVKNNLQTISALLRLQGRRLSSPEAKAAVEESSRRIRSIALVHESLSHAIGDDVAFIDIVRQLARMVEEGLVSPERPLRIVVSGDPGTVPADVATPMAVVLTELLQNVIDHAYPSGAREGAEVRVDIEIAGTRLHVTVTDNGVGTRPGFSIDDGTGLGLSIVRTLVTTELAGTIAYSAGDGRGDRPGTAVRISVPVRR